MKLNTGFENVRELGDAGLCNYRAFVSPDQLSEPAADSSDFVQFLGV